MGRFVSVGALNLLRRIDCEEDKELVYEQGGGWWVGSDTTTGRYALELIRFCLLRQEHEQGESFERYTLNEEGRAALADEDYKPMIVAALAERYGAR